MEKKPNRLYKARLFVMIFEDKRKLLELYNAISGKHYEDPELLEWSYVKKKYKLNMPFLWLAYPAKASAFSSNAA